MIENKEKLVCKYPDITGKDFCVGSKLCGKTTRIVLSVLKLGNSKGTEEAIEKLKKIKNCNGG